MDKTEITIAMNDRGSATAVGVDLLPHRDALDDLLDEYRLRADLGLPLTADIPGEAQR